MKHQARKVRCRFPSYCPSLSQLQPSGYSDWPGPSHQGALGSRRRPAGAPGGPSGATGASEASEATDRDAVEVTVARSMTQKTLPCMVSKVHIFLCLPADARRPTLS